MPKKSGKKSTQMAEGPFVEDDEKKPFVTTPKKVGNEIDEIFAGKKRKKPDNEKAKKDAGDVEASKSDDKVDKTKKKKRRKDIRKSGGDKENGNHLSDQPSRRRKRTGDGLAIYTEEELGIGKADAGASFPVATILQSAFYTTFNLFAGFLVPRRRIPKWWIWLHYLTPTSWSLNGLLTSQYGDIKKEIEAFGESKTVAAFLRDYFGYDYSQLPVVAVVLILFPIAFASIFILSMGKLNFQRR